MVVVPAGEFVMGSYEGPDDEKPPQNITIATPLAVGRFEVTFGEWDGCVAFGGCAIADSRFGRGSQPVINVSWEEAKKYVEWLSKRTGKTYRLLSEAEWEYAARAGTTTLYSFGDNPASLEINDHAWFDENAVGRSHAVGEKKPNKFGLHDMHGNVWEWVEDCHRRGYYTALADGRAQGPPYIGGCGRVYRGGAWSTDASYLRSAARNLRDSNKREIDIGFRVARDLSVAPTI